MAQTILITENFTEVTTKSIDERKRISIGGLAGSLFKGISRFKIFRGAQGDVLLRPVVEVPAQEAWLYQNKEALKSVRKGIRESARGKAARLDGSLLAPEE